MKTYHFHEIFSDKSDKSMINSDNFLGKPSDKKAVLVTTRLIVIHLNSVEIMNNPAKKVTSKIITITF